MLAFMVDGGWIDNIITMVVTTIATVSVLLKRLKTISARLEPNGGASMPDSLDRIEGEIKLMKNDLAVQKSWWVSYLQGHDERLFQANSRGDWIWVNDSLLEFIDCTTYRALGTGWITRIVREEQITVSAAWLSAITARRPINLPVRFVLPNGEIKECSLAAWPDDSGNYVGRLRLV